MRLALLLLILIATTLGSAASAERGIQGGVQPTFFGTYAWSSRYMPADEPSIGRQLGMGTAQIVVDWRLIEFTTGYNDLAEFDNTAIAPTDAKISQMLAAGFRPIVMVANPPSWALVTPETQGPLRSDAIGRFARFIGKLVARYRSVPYFVLAPESDARPFGTPGCGGSQLRSGWAEDPSGFVAMVQQAYSAAKAANPSVQVIPGALAYDNWCGSPNPGFNTSTGGQYSFGFLDSVLAAGGAPYFDIVAFNAYAYFSPGWEANAPGYDVAAKASYF